MKESRVKPVYSGIYIGYLRHRRFVPKQHFFTYRVFMMYLDLEEVDEVLSLSSFWSKKPFRPARFDRSDYLGSDNQSLSESVRKHIRDITGVEHTGPIRMLANLRYFGFSINPIVCFYCFDEEGGLSYVVNEVTNTPWKERIAYVLKCDPNTKYQRISFEKGMHVSPFNPIDMSYTWHSNQPGERLNVHLGTEQEGCLHVDATLALKRTEITKKSLNQALFNYPFMSAKVVILIYWQALKLYFKKVPVYDNPSTAGTSTKPLS